MSKLTLSVDDAVIARAKRYAKRNHISLSRLVETYLDSVSADTRQPTDLPPVLRSLIGTLHRGSRNDYRKHLLSKYR
jgi:hypothetical protein